MDKFDFNDQPVVRRPSLKLNIWDMLSVLVLLATLGLAAYFVFVFVNPTTPLNPLYVEMPTPLLFPTETITPIQLGPTWTPTFISITDTPTLAATITLQPSPTGFSLVPPTRTPSPTATPKAPFSADVSAIESTIIHPDAGCGWFGIGGSVVDTNNAPMIYMRIRLVGTLNGMQVNEVTVSGTALDYGQSGWEFVLGTAPIAADKTLYVQLLDQNGLPLAGNVYITTYTDCKKNLILVRFKKNR